MPFEPVELQREMRKTEPADANRPHTICLNRTPSEEWVAYFDTYDWHSLGLAPECFPKVVGDGIAIPDQPSGRPAVLFTRVDDAISGTNTVEAQRVANQPPSLQARYEKWFDERPPQA